MFDKAQFQSLIINPTLDKLGMYSKSAVNLLLGTMAQESHFGTYIHQLGKGPALGVYQMEPNTHDDIVLNFIKHRNSLKNLIESKFGYYDFDSARLVYDLRYATIMSRLHYYRISEPLPTEDNIEALAHYWKRYYNSIYGAGKEEEFVANYRKYIK